MSPSSESSSTDVAAAVAGVTVGPGAGYSWLGERVEVPAPVMELAAPEVVRNALVQGIARRLYGDFFACGGVRPATRGGGGAGRRRMSEALAAVNSGRFGLDPAWRVVGTEGAQTVVERAGLRLWVGAEDLVTQGPHPAGPGDEVSVLLAPDAPIFSPGFYMVLGEHGLDPDTPRLLDRFYLNLRVGGAEDCVRIATDRLNAAGLPFRLKVADDPDGFDRCDSAVVVFQRKDRERSVPEVLRLHTALAHEVDPKTPALTLRMRPGLAFAEDPDEGKSFGAHRCRLIAEAVVAAHHAGADSLAGRMAVVREHFQAAGTSVDAPHLGAHSAGDLEPALLLPDHEEPLRCP